MKGMRLELIRIIKFLKIYKSCDNKNIREVEDER